MRLHLSFALACFASMSLISCEPNVLPSKEPLQASSEFQIKNNRLIFKDETAFTKTRDYLITLDPNELSKWEAKTNFKSLRNGYYVDENQKARQLMDSFGFPAGYASLLNLEGEYQVENKIFWYYNGYRHEASNEQELKAIKANPSISKIKYTAGIQRSKAIDGDKATEATLQESNGRDYRYNFQPDIVNTNAPRRYRYATYVYTDERVAPNNHLKKYWTVLLLHIMLEYSTKDFWDNQTWRASADLRDIDIDILFTSQVQINSAVLTGDPALPSRVFINTPLKVKGSYTSDPTFQLGSTDLYAASPYGQTQWNDDSIYWDYSIFGYISQSKPGYVLTNGLPAEYRVSGPLWY